MTILPSVERELLDAVDRFAAPVAAPAPSAWRPRLPRRRMALVIALTTLSLAGVAGAVGLVSIGDPAGSPSPEAALGSEQLAGLNVSDPDGGPPWDIEFFDRRTGQHCAQVGRSAQGAFGVLGADDALHPLPVGGFLYTCGGRPTDSLDDGGRIATAALAARGLRSPCDGPGDQPCHESNARVFVYGVLGRHAVSLQFTAPGQAPQRLPLGRHGSFLIVRKGRGPIDGTLTAAWDDGHTTSGSPLVGDPNTFFLAKPDQP